MQICLHIGPHKTGTTSIQSYLLNSIGSSRPVVNWYPLTKVSEPGHAELARDWFLRDAQTLRELTAYAESAGVKRLIISAEDFDKLYSDRQEALRNVLAPFDVHLIVTLNSIVRRAASTWQESVKHGHAEPLENALDWILAKPGYRPDFIDVSLDVVRPSRTTIIIAEPDQPPGKLISDFCQAIGLSPPPQEAKVPRANVRLFKNEVELLRMMNVAVQGLNVAKSDALTIRRALLQAVLKTRVKELNYPPLVTPADMEKPLRLAALEMIAAIRRLREAGRVDVIGDLSALAAE